MKLKEMTKISGGALSVVAATFVSISAFGDSPLSAFYDFKDGADGTEASTVVDSSGTYTGEAHETNANGQKPKFSNDGPGMVVTGGVVICAAPHSLSFRYKDDATHQSGYVDIPGLATALAGRSAFTVEYFIKMVEGYNYGGGGDWDRYSKTAFYLKSSTSAFKQVAPGNKFGTHAANLNLERYTDSYNTGETLPFSHDLSDGNWYHVAIVFSETNPSTHEGTLAFYVNGSIVGKTQYVNTSGNGLKFRIGSGYLRITDNQDKTTTESIHASLSCLRVSGTALSPSEFLSTDYTSYVSGLDTMAFYSFNDGAAGAAASSATNTVDEILFPGTGANIGSGSVTFSAERPARYVYSDSRFSTLLADGPQSLFFSNGTSGNGGKVSLASLATTLTKMDAYTVEFFFKMSSSQDYRTMVGWKFGDNVGVKANLYRSDNVWSKCSFQVLTNHATSAVTTAGAGGIVTRPLYSQWHHFAAVYTKADNSIWTYIDGVKSDLASAVTNQDATAQLPLVLGTSAFSFKESTETFGGYISCVRVTPRALATDSFMTAAEESVPPNTVFALNFNEGTVGDRVIDGTSATGTTGVHIYPDEMYADIEYNQHLACTPQWAVGYRSGRMLKWGLQDMWETCNSLRFPAGSNARGQDWAQYYGAMLKVPYRTAGFIPARMNPASWTMEAFVKLEKYNLPDSEVKKALIFGKAGNTAPRDSSPVWYPRASWLLSYTSEGRLLLEWTERPTADFTGYSAGSTDYYKSVETAVTSLTDLRWHHVALSYDASAKQFVLYVDRSVVLTQPLLNAGESNALFDGNFAYYFGRFPTTGGFEGWMDEVRFSSKVLLPEEFEQFEPRGVLIFIQ